MKAFIAFLLFAALFGIIFPLSFAQQNQTTQQSDPEIETLKKRISELESKLQSVENVEKLELAAKLAEANAKLADAQTKLLNAEIDKYTGKLKDANDEWLRTWSLWFIGIISFFVVILLGVSGIFWFWLRARADQLIADEVEKRLKGFEAAVAQVNILRNQIRILEKEHAASVLEGSVHLPDSRGQLYSETTRALPDGGLLDLIADNTRGFDFRYKAAEVLAVRKNPKLIFPVLELLNSVIDSEVKLDDSYDSERRLHGLVDFLGQLHTQEAYDRLKTFFNRLLTENPRHKDIFLTRTVFGLAEISTKLGIGELTSDLKNVVQDLDFKQRVNERLMKLAVYFDQFNEPDGIIEMLSPPRCLIIGLTDVEDKCLKLLENHNPEFVEEWLRLKEAPDPETEESE